MNGEHLEIERKYLIQYPDTALLDQLENCEKIHITQTYLVPNGRVRKWETGDKITLSQSSSTSGIRFSVKSSAKTPLDNETIDKLREKGYEVRSRFGYDTIISLTIAS